MDLQLEKKKVWLYATDSPHPEKHHQLATSLRVRLRQDVSF